MRPYPAPAAERDRYIIELRRGRTSPDPWKYQDVIVEDERSDSGVVARVATVFLTGRECPWRCVMCDLWRQTTTDPTPTGAIAVQVTEARRAVAAGPAAITQMKLYNAASFFDPHAVPDADYEPIAQALAGLDRVVVESHPALVGVRVDRFVDALERAASDRGAGTRLEVAMGLETAHENALERLNKRMTVEMFMDAAASLVARGVTVRAFLLVCPPFIPFEEQDHWLQQSVDTAFSADVSVVSLIPTRSGNGAMEALEAAGDFREPTLEDVERSVALAQARRPPHGRVFADLWDLGRFSACADCAQSRRARLLEVNLTQQISPPVTCTQCGIGATP